METISEPTKMVTAKIRKIKGRQGGENSSKTTGANRDGEEDEDPGNPTRNEMEDELEEEETPLMQNATEQVRHLNRQYSSSSVGIRNQCKPEAKSKNNNEYGPHGKQGNPGNSHNHSSANTKPIEEERSKCITVSSSISSKNIMSVQAPSVEVIVDKNSKLYEEHMMQSGNLQSQADVKANLKRYVTSTLFSKLKFITSESQLDRNGKIADKLMNKMQVMEKYRDSFWDRNRAYINGWVRVKRNNIIMQIKETFMRKSS